MIKLYKFIGLSILLTESVNVSFSREMNSLGELYMDNTINNTVRIPFISSQIIVCICQLILREMVYFGSVSGWYPYPMIEIDVLGPVQVIRNYLILLAFSRFLYMIFFFFARLKEKQKEEAQDPE